MLQVGDLSLVAQYIGISLAHRLISLLLDSSDINGAGARLLCCPQLVGQVCNVRVSRAKILLRISGSRVQLVSQIIYFCSVSINLPL